MIAAVAAVYGKKKLAKKTRRIRSSLVGVALVVALLTTAIVGVGVYEANVDPPPPPTVRLDLAGLDLGAMTSLAYALDVPVKALLGVLLVERMTQQAVGCAVPWWLLLGVSHIESGAGTHGGAHIDDDWVVRPTIGGPPLDGNGFALVFEGGSVDYAEGPFQFIHASWRSFGLDASGDGVADIDNWLDAALGAANHLCHSAGGPGLDLSAEDVARRGIFGYNPSSAYVDDVWSSAVDYRVGATRFQPVAGDMGVGAEPATATGQLVDVGPCARAAGCQLDAGWAPHLLGLLQACGGGYTIISANRTYAEQVVLYERYLNGGGLAARPGTSNHEGGQAVDLSPSDGPGDPAWECLKAQGPRFGVYQDPSITGRDSVHWSVTGN